MNKLLQAVQLIQQAAMGLPAGSPIWKAANHAAGQLGKHLPQGAPTVGVQMTQAKDMIQQIMKNSFLPHIMKQIAGGGGGGGQGAGAPQPPMPSTPLPGA